MALREKPGYGVPDVDDSLSYNVVNIFILVLPDRHRGVAPALAPGRPLAALALLLALLRRPHPSGQARGEKSGADPRMLGGRRACFAPCWQGAHDRARRE
ncbi:MAG TPA: hypothetical protein VF171_09560 [Trueperaceae bacterium]